MNYYINPIWFYLAGISGNVATCLAVAGSTILIVVVGYWLWISMEVSTDGRRFNPDSMERELNSYGKDLIDRKNRFIRKWLPVAIISFVISSLLPSKETCIEMMISSLITEENVSSATENIYNIIDYVEENFNDKK